MTSRLALRCIGRKREEWVQSPYQAYLASSASFLTWTQAHAANRLPQLYLTWSVESTVLILTLLKGVTLIRFGLLKQRRLLFLLLFRSSSVGFLLFHTVRLDGLRENAPEEVLWLDGANVRQRRRKKDFASWDRWDRWEKRRELCSLLLPRTQMPRNARYHSNGSWDNFETNTKSRRSD